MFSLTTHQTFSDLLTHTLKALGSISNVEGGQDTLRAILSIGELREKGHFFIDNKILEGTCTPGFYVSVLTNAGGLKDAQFSDALQIRQSDGKVPGKYRTSSSRFTDQPRYSRTRNASVILPRLYRYHSIFNR